MMTLATLIAAQIGHADFSLVTTPSGEVSVVDFNDNEIAGLDIKALQEQAQSQATAAQARAQRNALLAEADIAVNKAFDAGVDTTALKLYRQALRDVPQQPGFPETITWPEMPQ